MEIFDWKKEADAQGKATTTVGRVQVIANFAAPQLQCTRRIWIYLPPDYTRTSERYPILYMQDGQNLFDAYTAYAGEWQVDKTMEGLVMAGKTEGLIIVGIDNGLENRLAEYTPEQQGRQYAAFVTDTLKPFIEENFRCRLGREHTGIAGSSLGGLISLYIALSRPELFSKVGAFSPALYFADAELRSMTKRLAMKIYLDVGTKEELPYQNAKEYADFVWNAYYHLVCAGFTEAELRFIVEKDAGHNEAAWAQRFPQAVLWLYQK